MSLRLQYTATKKDSNKSLGDFLKQQDLSKKAIIALKHQGGEICVNKEVQTTRCKLRAGDEISVTFPDEPVSNKLFPIEVELHIVYEDDYIMVVDKKEGMPVIATGNHQFALANGILAYYEKIGLNSTVHFVNRLDRGTSGLLVVAKYRHVHHLMTMNIKRVTRKYYARVAGVIKDKGCINAQIFRPSATSIKRIVDLRGKRAVTHFEAIEVIDNTTIVRCVLETGRTHQIRVHLAHIGHPILKDPLYGEGRVEDMQLLHSYFIKFSHPISGEELSFETEIPSRFLKT